MATAIPPSGAVAATLRPHPCGGLSGGLYRGGEVICDMYLPEPADKPGRAWDHWLLAHGLPRIGPWEHDGVSWTALVTPALPACSWCGDAGAVAYATTGTPPTTWYACPACRDNLGEQASPVATRLLPSASPEPSDLDLSTPVGLQVTALYLELRTIEETDGSWNGDAVIMTLDRWLTRLGFDVTAPRLDAEARS